MFCSNSPSEGIYSTGTYVRRFVYFGVLHTYWARKPSQESSSEEKRSLSALNMRAKSFRAKPLGEYSELQRLSEGLECGTEVHKGETKLCSYLWAKSLLLLRMSCSL